MPHPNSLKALEKNKWKKGDPSPNPSGRPKRGLNLLLELEAIVNEAVPDDKKKRSFGRVISEMIVLAAAKGDTQTAFGIFDRLCGKPRQVVELGGLEGAPDIAIELRGASLEQIQALKAEAEARMRKAGIPIPGQPEKPPTRPRKPKKPPVPAPSAPDAGPEAPPAPPAPAEGG